MVKRIRIGTWVVVVAVVAFALGFAVATQAQTGDKLDPLPAGEAYQPNSAEEHLASVYNDVITSVVNISVAKESATAMGSGGGVGTGSGFVIDSEGYIVTNNHVAEDAAYIDVTFVDGTRREAELVGNDPDSDLAVIKIDPAGLDLSPVELANSDDVFVGQQVMAIGSPFNQDFTLTTGIISALDRNLSTETRFSIPHIIQTDTAINPGNSGGPLLNLDGQVVGVNTAILSGSGSASGVGFSVPANTVRRIVPYLIQNGDYNHVWLGITGTTLRREQVRAMELAPDRQGIVVADVVEDGPAAEAGLQGSDDTIDTPIGPMPVGGDVIYAINGTPISQMNQLIGYLESNTRPGDTVELSIVRDGTEQTLTLTLKARPEAP